MKTTPNAKQSSLRGASGSDEEVFELIECEVETLRRAALERGLPFDPLRSIYKASELKAYGLAREAYNQQELRARGILPATVTSFDDVAGKAESLTPVETPFASGIRKWQLPIDMLPLQTMKTVLPPGTVVTSHTHPPHSKDSPGGGLRIVTSGSIEFRGKKFGPGDWFFCVNGEPYEFVTDPSEETVVFYTYRFFAVEEGNRFSAPH